MLHRRLALLQINDEFLALFVDITTDYQNLAMMHMLNLLENDLHSQGTF